ncbi:MAG: hypothetical protein ACREXM_08060 [Gammaproteobacteria bacterium]
MDMDLGPDEMHIVPAQIGGLGDPQAVEGKDVPNIREYEWLKVRSVRVPEAIKLITDSSAKAKPGYTILRDRLRCMNRARSAHDARYTCEAFRVLA